MGGAAGHIRQIWEATELTFGDLKNIITKSLNGEIEASEKLDGQNIVLTFKNKKVLVARMPKHLKNFAEEALDICEFKKYFEERGSNECVINAFVGAAQEFQNIFDKIENLDRIFKNGRVWINAEILYERTENVIPYGINQIRIHHFKELDENGKTLKIFSNDNFIEDIEKNQVPIIFLIKKTNNVIVNPVNNKEYFLNKLEILRGHLSNDNTIDDYLEYKMYEFIKASKKLEESFVNNLAKRWGKGDKSINIRELLKNQSSEINEWVRTEDSDLKIKIESFLEPFIILFSELGIIVLKNLTNITSSNKQESTDIIKNKLENAINYLNTYPNTDIIKFLNRLKKLGGESAIVPVEGIVFDYNGQLLKLTGSFTSILRIIGFYRFGS